MTIKTLQIEYFESHKDTIIEFDDKFTAIVGTSDKGKSSIIRALRWNIENLPSSDWLSWFAGRGKSCSSALEFKEESWVMRMKKGTENSYICSDDENDPLHAFRKDVPNRVTAITRMDERNIKSQHDPYFMFQDSSGNVARRLNKIVGNDDINKFFKRVDSIIDSSKREMNRTEKVIKEKQESVESMKWIDSALKRIKRIDSLTAKHAEVSTKRIQLESIVNEVNKLHVFKAECLTFLEIKPLVEKLQATIHNINGVRHEHHIITGILEELKLETDYKKAADLFIKDATPKYLILKSLIDDLNIAREQRLVIENITRDTNNMITYSLTAQKTLSELKVKYVKILKAAKICPTCGQSTKGVK